MEKRYFKTAIDVRYRDTDSMGHVAAPVYYEYMLHAYLTFMHDLLDVPPAEKIPHIMGKTSCEYKLPARYGDVINIKSSVTRFGTKSFDVEYLMELDGRADKLIAVGQSSHVTFDYQSNMPIAIPDEFKQSVLRFQNCL
jgi:acyl-CoA thioester hydrolase